MARSSIGFWSQRTQGTDGPFVSRRSSAKSGGRRARHWKRCWLVCCCCRRVCVADWLFDVLQVLEMGKDQPGRRDVRGKGDIIDITDLEHGIDIRLMRVCGQRIPEEHDCLDLVGSDHRTNLKVPSFLSGIYPGDMKAGQFLNQATCALRGNQLFLSQHLLVIPAQCD